MIFKNLIILTALTVQPCLLWAVSSQSTANSSEYFGQSIESSQEAIDFIKEHKEELIIIGEVSVRIISIIISEEKIQSVINSLNYDLLVRIANILDTEEEVRSKAYELTMKELRSQPLGSVSDKVIELISKKNFASVLLGLKEVKEALNEHSN